MVYTFDLDGMAENIRDKSNSLADVVKFPSTHGNILGCADIADPKR